MARYNATTGETDFGMALDSLKRGERIKRRNWVDAYVSIKDGGFYMRHHDKDVAWVPTWEEMLSNDWSEVV